MAPYTLNIKAGIKKGCCQYHIKVMSYILWHVSIKDIKDSRDSGEKALYTSKQCISMLEGTGA